MDQAKQRFSPYTGTILIDLLPVKDI